MAGSHSVVAWIASSWLFVGLAVGADGEKPVSKPALRTGEAAIGAALGEPTQWALVETPLSEVVDFLKNRHHVEIQINRRALDDVGIGGDTPITKKLDGVSLRAALNLTLRDLGLAWTIRDEVLWITTPEGAELTLTTKVYDVCDLVVCYDRNDEPWDDYDTLIDQITNNLHPTTWGEVGGPGSITGASLGTAKVLVVNQTYQIHREIAALLEKIREVGRRNPDDELPRRDRPKAGKP